MKKGTASYETWKKAPEGSLKQKLYKEKINPNEPNRKYKNLIEEFIQREKHTLMINAPQINAYSEYQCQVIKKRPKLELLACLMCSMFPEYDCFCYREHFYFVSDSSEVINLLFFSHYSSQIFRYKRF